MLDRWARGEPRLEAAVGDLIERFDHRCRNHGITAASVTFWRDAFPLLFRSRRPAAPDGLRWGRMQRWRGEWRDTVRRLLRNPAFTLTVIVTMSGAVAANTAIVAVVDGVLLRPLAYPAPDRLVSIEHPLPGYPIGDDEGTAGGPAGLIALYRDEATTLRSVAGYSVFEAGVTGPAGAEFVRTAHVTPSMFTVLGIEPAVGRVFHHASRRADEATVGETVLSFDLWQRRYGGDPQLVGRHITVDGFSYEVVGVMPETFRFVDPDVKLWIPSQVTRDTPFRPWFASVVGRLAPGATRAAVMSELQPLVDRLPDVYPEPMAVDLVRQGRMRVVAHDLRTSIVGAVRPILFVALGATAAVFIVAIANLTNLVMVRADGRRTEMAIRSALGASLFDRRRLFALEAWVLVSVSTILGIALAGVALDALIPLAPSDLPRIEAIAVSPLALAVGATLGGVALLVLTLVPSVGSGAGTSAALRASRGTAGRASLRVRHGLIGTQLAMGVVLLTGTVLLSRSFAELTGVDPGFRPDNVLTFRVPFPTATDRARGGNGVAAARFHLDLADRLARIPGVLDAGFGGCVPFVAACDASGITITRGGHARVTDADQAFAHFQVVGPDFFNALGVPITRGRTIDARDVETRANVAVISDGAARRYWPDEDPLGAPFTFDGVSDLPYVVVGVTEDVKFEGFRDANTLAFYVPALSEGSPMRPLVQSYVVRTAVPALSVVRAAQDALHRLDPSIPLAGTTTLRDVVRGSTADLRFATWLVSSAGAVSAALAALGIYGLVSYATSLRRDELRIRVALGATPATLRRLVLGQGLLASVGGLTVGVLFALFAARLLRGLLFGVAPGDPVAPTLAALLLGAVALAAGYGPARRAGRANPADVLRGSD